MAKLADAADLRSAALKRRVGSIPTPGTSSEIEKFMLKDLIVKKSVINKKGFFAGRSFKKGEVVLNWHPKILTGADVGRLPKGQKHDVDKIGKDKYVLQNFAERFMNHACEPNTKVKNFSDVAIRNIKKGEEITSDYGRGVVLSFKCKCGSKKCRGTIK